MARGPLSGHDLKGKDVHSISIYTSKMLEAISLSTN